MVVLTDDDAETDGPIVKPRDGRFGALFGSVVHQAIARALRDDVNPRLAVDITAEAWGLELHLSEAVADVQKALDGLKAAGLARRPGNDLQLEYPVGALGADGFLVTGYVDLVGTTDTRLDVIDFKTDAPPTGRIEEAYPQYAEQVRIYGRILDAAGVRGNRELRCGLLFTADGVIRWVAPQ